MCMGIYALIRKLKLKSECEDDEKSKKYPGK